MGSQEGAPITQEEAQLIRRPLISEIEQRMNEPRHRRRPLAFENFGHQMEVGWYLLKCSNEETRDWLLQWEPQTYHSLVMRRSTDAPWPTRIIIELATEVIEPNRLV